MGGGKHPVFPLAASRVRGCVGGAQRLGPKAHLPQRHSASSKSPAAVVLCPVSCCNFNTPHFVCCPGTAGVSGSAVHSQWQHLSGLLSVPPAGGVGSVDRPWRGADASEPQYSRLQDRSWLHTHLQPGHALLPHTGALYAIRCFSVYFGFLSLSIPP